MMMKARSLIQALRAAPNYEVLVELNYVSYDELEVVVDESLQLVRIRILDTWRE